MKKIFLIALAAIGMTACMQEEVMDTPTGGAITFENAFVDNATRAAAVIDNANLNEFQVWGFVNAPSGVVFNETIVSKDTDTGLWSYDGTQYWAPDNDYYFAAVAPVSNNWELNTDAADVTGPGVLSFTNDAATDLVYAEKHVRSAAAGQANAAVALHFQHLLSKVKLTFKNGFLTENIKVNLYNIQMATPKTATIDLREAHTWEDFGADMTLDFVQKKQLASKDSYTTVEEFFILPTACGIQFDLDVFVGDLQNPVYTGHKTATLPADAFEMGHAYNLSAEINAASLDFDEITFTVDKVDEWDKAGNASDKAANLLYAAQIGGEITLKEDVVLDAPVVVPAGVELVLNLNGKTIKNSTQSEVFGEGEGIIAYGNLTINGEGTVEGSTMAVWARGNNGAKITINGGTYKGCAEGFAKGGRSVIYASSDNTIDIYGGTFKALAADKTSFANKTEGVYPVLNVADNHGMINVYGGTFVNQNPAAPGTEPAAWNAAHPNGFVAAYHKSTQNGNEWTVALDAVASVDEFKAALADESKTSIYLTPGATFEGVFNVNHKVTITSSEDNKATIKGRIESQSSAVVTYENIKFDYNNSSVAGWNNSQIAAQNPKNHPAIIGTYASKISFKNCEFNFKSGYSIEKGPGAMTLYGSSDVKMVDCVLSGEGNPIYGQASIDITNSTVEMFGNNAILNLSYFESQKVIFKDNTVVNKSTNGSLIYGVQFLSTNGKTWKNVYFDVKDNSGLNEAYVPHGSYTFPGVTYGEGSATL